MVAASVRPSVRPSVTPPAPALPCASQQSWGHIWLRSLRPQPGRDRSTWSWKEETPAEYINISYFTLFKSWGLQVAKRAAVPLERNGVVSKVQVLPGQGHVPTSERKARGGREIPTSPCRSGPSGGEGGGGTGRVGSPMYILNSDQRVGCAARSPPAQGCGTWHPARGGWWGKRCSVRQCAAAAGAQRGEYCAVLPAAGAAGSWTAPFPASPGGLAVPLPSRDGGWLCVASQKAVLAMLAGAKILGRLSRVSSSRR